MCVCAWQSQVIMCVRTHVCVEDKLRQSGHAARAGGLVSLSVGALASASTRAACIVYHSAVAESASSAHNRPRQPQGRDGLGL